MAMVQRASIKFCVKLGKTFTETLEMFRKAYGDQVLSRTTVYEWFKGFKKALRKAENRWMTMSAEDGQRQDVRMIGQKNSRTDKKISLYVRETY